MLRRRVDVRTHTRPRLRPHAHTDLYRRADGAAAHAVADPGPGQIL